MRNSGLKLDFNWFRGKWTDHMFMCQVRISNRTLSLSFRDTAREADFIDWIILDIGLDSQETMDFQYGPDRIHPMLE